ncbi:MAG: hypothetical protein FWF50_03210 [Defluviitaleaceae bacterium]|nr:hypothetical protein [Defluviitaleaceae bacterium]
MSKSVFIKKTMIPLLAGLVAFGTPLSALATDVVSGYAVISEDATTIEEEVQGEVTIFGRLRNSVSNGTLTGTWTHGNANLGTAIFSSITGSSQNNNSRAQARGTVRNGSGNENTGGWQLPGVNSRGQIIRTITGTNSAFWDLRRP